MITFPCAKINFGLNVVAKRDDGYHELETVFYPIPLCDRIEITPQNDNHHTSDPCKISVIGPYAVCDNGDNLVVKAYRLLASMYTLPPVNVSLHKQIPSQAGLGGGSSDAAFMLILLNDMFDLRIGKDELCRISRQLGADCPFFVHSSPMYATGIGDVFSPLNGMEHKLKGHKLIIVKPDVGVSTAEAYAGIKPHRSIKNCGEVFMQGIETWKNELINDFEEHIFDIHPILKQIKLQLYEAGALYAQMSGSGSAMYGVFKEVPEGLSQIFGNFYHKQLTL